MPVDKSEVKQLRKALTRWHEDLNDQAEELSDRIAELESKAGVKKQDAPPAKKKQDDDDGDDDKEEDSEREISPF